MRLKAALVPGLALALAVVAALADRALVGQAETERVTAALRIDEEASAALSAVRTALAQIEQAVLSRQAPEGVDGQRLAIPSLGPGPNPGFVPYGERSRAELAALLSSAETTPSGLPEAVVARLALGPAAPVSGAAAPPPVEARLLAGELPVRAEDLPFLAGRLGLENDPRVRALEEQLRAAPAAPDLPSAPDFRRRLTGPLRIEGWSRSGPARVRYELPVALWLGRAGVSERAEVTLLSDPGDGSEAGGGDRLLRALDVPEIPGLVLQVTPRLHGGLRLTALRAVLWLSAVAGVVGLLVLRRALEREARALRRERAFLAGVTHELRTPLTSIRVFGETLAEGRGDPREYGALVAQESQRLEGLVERVLTLTRVELAARFGPVDPAELIRSVVAVALPRAARRSTQVESRVGDGLPVCQWDGGAVQRALLNLLDNALTHGREGGRVEVLAEFGGGEVRLSVSDDGPGIGRADHRRIFGRFERGRSETPGTGLGLYLVEEVARAHGGRVDLVTAEGRGSTFTLVLPVCPAGSTTGAPA
jgi:signal transduction histidine kinase